jgi:hypothetical protein
MSLKMQEKNILKSSTSIRARDLPQVSGYIPRETKPKEYPRVSKKAIFKDGRRYEDRE